jgi:hypothetical protein
MTDCFHSVCQQKTCWQPDETLGEMSAEATTGFSLHPPAVIDFTDPPQFGETAWFTRLSLSPRG